ncbi:hypothetical protein ACWCXE_02355 [Streptomyces sp. NPDC001780]
MTDHQNAETPSASSRRAEALRLLPWSTPDGKPCFLSADGSDSTFSRLADDVEEAQTSLATEVLENAQRVCADPLADTSQLRLALARANESLGEVLRVAVSRGARLPRADDDEGDGPRLPAEAFG